MIRNRKMYVATASGLVCAALVIWIVGIRAAGSGVAEQSQSTEAAGLSNSADFGIIQTSPAAADGRSIPAILSGGSTIMLVAKRDGVLASVCCEEGSMVLKDQIIADLNDDGSRAALHQAELEATRMRIEQEQLNALVELNKSDLERQNMLYKSGLISRRDLDQAQYKLLSTRQDLKKVLLGMQVAQAKIDEASAGLERGSIRAPLTGTIAHSYAQLGASVVRGERLFEISASGPLNISFQIPETERQQLRVGSIVDISQVDSASPIAQARVLRFDPIDDASTSSLRCVAEVFGGSALIPGTAVQVRIRENVALMR